MIIAENVSLVSSLPPQAHPHIPRSLNSPITHGSHSSEYLPLLALYFIDPSIPCPDSVIVLFSYHFYFI